MLRLARALWNDEVGLVISAELVLVLTVGVLMLVVGLHAVSKAVNQELNDVSNAFGTISQSFKYDGLKKPYHSYVSGSAFKDRGDDCDCTEIRQVKPQPKYDNGNGPENH